jgi:hypothetical protein
VIPKFEFYELSFLNLANDFINQTQSIMKRIILLFSTSLFISSSFAQSILLEPDKMSSMQSAVTDNIILQGTNPPNIVGIRHNGTLTVPTATSTGSFLLSLDGKGHNSTAITGTRGLIRYVTTENWTPTANGTKIEFHNTANGSTFLTQRMVINQDGNVGIGTSTPGFLLNFANTVGDKIALWGNTGNHYGFGIQGSLLQVHTDLSTSDVAFGYGTSAAFTETMRIKGDGNVGIGITTPAAKLEVKGTAAGMISRFDGGAGMFISLRENGVYRGYLGSYAGAAEDVDFGTGAGNTTGKLHLTIQAVPKLTINNVGKVGIGTTTPTGKLHIEHDGTDTDPHIRIHSTGSYSRINWSTNTNANVWTAQSYLESATTASNYWRLEYGGSPKLYIAGDGNVGIGTSTPDNKLDVLGTIRANELIVETGWADYVFKDDYQLKPLSEVEAFIKENKHLPSVPSAATIQDKGAHVAELMTKMMEKIEELTLYSIQQKKEIDELKKRLDEKK